MKVLGEIFDTNKPNTKSNWGNFDTRFLKCSKSKMKPLYFWKLDVSWLTVLYYLIFYLQYNFKSWWPSANFRHLNELLRPAGNFKITFFVQIFSSREADLSAAPFWLRSCCIFQEFDFFFRPWSFADPTTIVLFSLFTFRFYVFHLKRISRSHHWPGSSWLDGAKMAIISRGIISRKTRQWTKIKFEWERKWSVKWEDSTHWL